MLVKISQNSPFPSLPTTAHSYCDTFVCSATKVNFVLDEKIPILAESEVPRPKDDLIPVVVFGISLASLGRSGQFIACSVSIFFFFVLYGYLQELIFSYGNFKPYGWHLTLMQFFFYSIFGFLEQTFSQSGQRKIPILTYAFLAFLSVATMGCSNTSLGYLNYPTQVIFKCCKLIPVMVGGIFIQSKRYTIVDFFAVLMMTVGLIFFTIADQSVSPNFNMTGVRNSIPIAANAHFTINQLYMYLYWSQKKYIQWVVNPDKKCMLFEETFSYLVIL